MIRALALALACAWLATPAAGDWLVTRDGTRLETTGPWQVKGRQVIFTRPGGALAALRLADVDLEASAAATEASRAAAAAPPAPPPDSGEVERRPPVMVLTNADLPSGDTGSGERDDGDEDGEEDGEEGDDGDDGDDGDEQDDGASADPGSATGEPLVVVTWRELESSAVDGLEIIGSVRNRGRNVAADIRLLVTVADQEGTVLAEARAFLQRSSLVPGQSSTFRALIPGVYSLSADPTFELTSEGFSIQVPAPPEGSSDDDELDDFGEPDESGEGH